MKVILYPMSGGGIAVIAPVQDSGMTIEQIAQENVPTGVPWKIVDDADVPKDRTFRGVWGCDFTSEDGGITFTPPTPTLEDQLAAIEAEYAPKISELQTALVAATLTDGAIMDGNISSLRTEWTALLNAKSAAMEALLI